MPELFVVSGTSALMIAGCVWAYYLLVYGTIFAVPLIGAHSTKVDHIWDFCGIWFLIFSLMYLLNEYDDIFTAIAGVCCFLGIFFVVLIGWKAVLIFGAPAVILFFLFRIVEAAAWMVRSVLKHMPRQQKA